MISISGEVKYLKGVGPQRAEALAKRGIVTLADLIAYLPFRYEDRSHFAKVRELTPGQTATLRVEVVEGQLLRYARSRNAMYHLIVRDDTGRLYCRFFHGGYLENRFKPGQQLVVHGKADFDPNRPARMEMVNPQVETLGAEPGDSTEVGRIVPIYEAIGNVSSRMLRRIIRQALESLPGDLPDLLPESLRARYQFPSRREALVYVHFPPQTEDHQSAQRVSLAGALAADF